MPITLSKFAMLNFIGDVKEPRYHDRHVIISATKIKRSKYDIKLRFSGVNGTSEYAGDWFLPRKKALTYKTFLNNGLFCKAIPWSAFDKIELINREDI